MKMDWCAYHIYADVGVKEAYYNYEVTSNSVPHNLSRRYIEINN
jgi:hypothetical protein